MDYLIAIYNKHIPLCLVVHTFNKFMKQINIVILFLLVTYCVKSQTYNHYRGNIHSHTAYSDGNDDSTSSHINNPLLSFNYTKASAYMDFLGISEHNHSEGGLNITLSKYADGVKQASH